MAVMSCECDALEHAIRVVEVEAAASGTKKANRPSFVPARIAVERSSIVPLQEQATHLVCWRRLYAPTDQHQIVWLGLSRVSWRPMIERMASNFGKA